MDNVDAFIDAYVSSYVMDGDGELYVPTEDEQRLIAHAIKGLVAQPEFVAKFAAQPVRLPMPKGVSDEEILAICKRHLKGDGDFDFLASARELLATAMKREPTHAPTLSDEEVDRLWNRFASSAGGAADHRAFARAVLDATRH